MVLEKSGRDEDALEAELPVLLSENNEDAALCMLATRLMKLRSSRANQHARAALSINPQNVDANKILGECLVRENHYTKAVTHLRRALFLKRDDAETWNLLGNAHKMANQYDESIGAYEQAISIDPAQTYFYSNLADLYEIFNEPEKVNDIIQRALRISPEDPYILFIAAKCDERNGNYHAGIQKLKKIDPSQVIDDTVMGSAFLLGRLQDAEGNCDAAFQSFKRIEKVN